MFQWIDILIEMIKTKIVGESEKLYIFNENGDSVYERSIYSC